jgi:hypothetical protein
MYLSRAENPQNKNKQNQDKKQPKSGQPGESRTHKNDGTEFCLVENTTGNEVLEEIEAGLTG